MMLVLVLASIVSGLGCADGGIIRIDARGDAGVGVDGGSDAGADAGVDGGCAPTPTPYAPADTGGPIGESEAACESRVGPSPADATPMGQRYLAATERLGMPYRVALVEGGEWQAPDHLAEDPFFKGYVVFLLAERFHQKS